MNMMIIMNNNNNNNLDVDGEDTVRSRRLFVERVSSNGAVCFTLATTRTDLNSHFTYDYIMLPVTCIDQSNTIKLLLRKNIRHQRSFHM